MTTENAVEDPMYGHDETVQLPDKGDERNLTLFGGREYLIFYNDDKFISALITLMHNPSNAAAMKEIEKINVTIKKYNEDKSDFQPFRGVFRVEEMATQYSKAREAQGKWENATDEEKSNIERNIQKVYEDTKKICEKYGYPRSFSWPSKDPAYDVRMWWTKKLKEQENVDDGLPHTSEWKKRFKEKMNNSNGEGASNAQATAGSTRNQGQSANDVGNEDTEMGDASSGEQVEEDEDKDEDNSNEQGWWMIHWDDAKPRRLTSDGKKMLATLKFGKAYSVIVDEGNGYRIRSLSECGGVLYVDQSIISDLPVAGANDKEIVEKEAADFPRSNFKKARGIVQAGNRTYFYTEWEGSDKLYWMTKTKLCAALKSEPLVDQIIRAFGGTVPPKGMVKAARQLCLTFPQVNQVSQALPTTVASPTDLQAITQLLKLLKVNNGPGSFKHPSFAVKDNIHDTFRRLTLNN
jgi:hypothetical protein